MLFSFFAFLITIASVFSAVYMMSSPYTSRIYESYTWADSFTACCSDDVSKKVHKFLKESFQLPLTKIEVHGLPETEFFGKHSPLTVCLVHQSVYHLT